MTARRGSLEARLLRLEREAHIEPIVVLLRDFAGEIGNPERLHVVSPMGPGQCFTRRPDETPDEFRRRCCDAARGLGQPFVTLKEQNAPRLADSQAAIGGAGIGFPSASQALPAPFPRNHLGE